MRVIPLVMLMTIVTTTTTTTTMPKLMLVDRIPRFFCYRGELCMVHVDESFFNYRNLSMELDSNWLYKTSNGSFIGVPMQSGFDELQLSVSSSMGTLITRLEVFVNTQDEENNHIKIGFNVNRSLEVDNNATELELRVDFVRKFSDYFKIPSGEFFLYQFDMENHTAVVILTDMLCDSVNKAKMEYAVPFAHSMDPFQNLTISMRNRCPVGEKYKAQDLFLVGSVTVLTSFTVFFILAILIYLYKWDYFSMKSRGNKKNEIQLQNCDFSVAQDDFFNSQRSTFTNRYIDRN